MTFPAYPAYRESGVEWLGPLPRGWAVKRVKHVTRSIEQGWSPQCDGFPVASADEWGVLKVGCVNGGRFNPEENKALPAELTPLPELGIAAGDVLISRANTRELVGGAVCVSADHPNLLLCDKLYRLRLNDAACMPQWLAVYLRSDAARGQIELAASGASQSMVNIGQGTILDLPMPLPMRDEQSQILAFLDRETGKIDALVAEQERLIALLKQKRQAVISQAVTKGLDASVPMKDSGVAWLGQVPAHWEVLRLGALFREAIEEGEHDLPVLSVSIHDGVSDRELSDSEMDRKVTRSEDRTKYKKVAVGDLVYNMMRAWQGGFGTVAVAGMVSPAYVVARPRGDLRTAFVEFVLRTPQAIEEMRRYSKGVTDFRLRLYWDEFKQIVLAVPPLTEQASILAAIDDQAARFDTLTTEAHSAIALLRERRAALISAAVTGKIDVRGICLSVDEAA